MLGEKAGARLAPLAAVAALGSGRPARVKGGTTELIAGDLALAASTSGDDLAA